jgi:hypothetical protein
MKILPTDFLKQPELLRNTAYKKKTKTQKTVDPWAEAIMSKV